MYVCCALCLLHLICSGLVILLFFSSKRPHTRFALVTGVQTCAFRCMRPGEFRALVGQNGCGKSTTIKILAGFYTADKGEIRLHGERRSEERRVGQECVSTWRSRWTQ